MRHHEGSGQRRSFAVWPAVLTLVMGLPVLWLLVSAVLALGGSNGLAATMLPVSVRDTGLLMLGVGTLAGAAGLVAAWLVTHYEFPGRRALEWALVLPLAIPTYLAAYAYVEVLGFPGPVQSLVRAITGAQTLQDYWFFEIRSDWGALLVLSSVLYPYVYVACRALFLMQSTRLSIAARTLGAGRLRTFFRVTLPLSRPALVVGMTLAMMEVVNDLGAVQYFGINSITAIIYSTWINRSDFGGAAQLAVTVVLIIGVLITLEQWARSNRAYHQARDSQVPPAREYLEGGAAIGATAFCVVLVLLGFGVPGGQMAYLAFRLVLPETVALTLTALVPTLLLATLGALITVAIGFLTARAAQGQGSGKGLLRIATLGYAVPGTVLALGLLRPLGQADLWVNRLTVALAGWRPGLILSGSVAALLYVYAIRFLAVSHANLDAAIRKRGDTMLQAGRVLGAGRWRLFWRIDLPTLSPAMLTAAVLVFVEIVKELPATLLLRPLGLDTLATIVYARANVGLFAQAALPALTIVLIGLVPVLLATRLSDRRKV